MFRLLLKFLDFTLPVRDYDSKPGGILLRNRHDGNRHIRVVRFMVVEHHLVVHLIDMVTGQDQHIVRMVLLHVSQILVNRIRSPCIPLRLPRLLIRREDCDAALIAVQIPRNADADMSIESQRLILGQDTDCVDSRIDAVAERKINDPVLSPERNGRLCNLRRQYAEA